MRTEDAAASSAHGTADGANGAASSARSTAGGVNGVDGGVNGAEGGAARGATGAAASAGVARGEASVLNPRSVMHACFVFLVVLARLRFVWMSHQEGAALFGSLLGVPSTVFHVWSQTLLLVSHAGQARQQSLATRTRVIRVYMLMRGLQGLCVLMAGCGWIAAPSALLSSIRPWGLLLSINIEETNMAAYSVPFAQQASLSATDAVVCSLYFAFMPGLTWRQVASWSSLMVGSLGLQVALTRWWCMRRSSAWRGDKAKQEEFASKAKHE
uniref:Uncharacterized protein n=1 Tax=Chlamydomonas euryale TaxID=1486919 RepID=A0A7R9Z5W7_9CHLO